jgi:integrase
VAFAVDNVDSAYKNVSTVPAKHSRPRRIRVSAQLLNMLLALPRNSDYVFSPSGNKERLPKELEHFSRNFTKCRRRIALKLKNQRIQEISLRTFRHWKATMLYLKTKDILYVKEFLGHVNINNTLKYVHIANAIVKNEDSYSCKAVEDVNQAQQLIEQGFEYVATTPQEVMLFRKRK